MLHTHAKDPVAESYNRTHVTDIHMLKILWQRATTGHMLHTHAKDPVAASYNRTHVTDTYAKDPVAASYNRTHVTVIHTLKILWQRATTGHMLQTYTC